MVVGILMAMYASLSAAVQERRERTFVIVKPDGVQRGLIGKVVSRFEKNGFKLVAMKFLQVGPRADFLSEAHGVENLHG